MTQHEKIVDRIRKLLALAESANVNEAAAAMSQAQRLMTEHQISEADLEEPGIEIGQEILFDDGKTRVPNWRKRLALDIAQANTCAILMHRDKKRRWRIDIVGAAMNVEVVKFLFAYCCSEIERLAAQESKRLARPGRSWLTSFRFGAAYSIGKRIKASAEAAKVNASEGVQLVLRSQMDQVKDFVDDVSDGTTKSRHRPDPAATAAGYAAGDTVNLDHGKGLHSGVRGMLGSG
jgi:hypothetical protein